jgi:SNF2 family DNA or RNA helicase
MKAEDYLELPDFIPVTVPVILEQKAKDAYRKLEKEMLLEVDESTIDAGTAAVLTNKLLQLCNGAVYTENREAVEIHKCKIEAFLELIEGLNGKPALVFYNFQHDLARLKKALSGSGLQVRELKGVQDETDWNNRQIDILLAHPASSAYGLNLQQGGNHVIWFGLNWSLELYQQANKRLHRQGQTEKVIVHHLVVDGGMDEDVMAALESKGATQDRLMEALKARIAKVTAIDRGVNL